MVLTPTDVDRARGAEALRKQAVGKSATQRELAALAKIQRYREANDRERFYREVSKGDYCRLAGRQQKIVDNHARLYGVPCLGPEVNLYEVVAWLHRLLVERGAQLGECQPVGHDALLAGTSQQLRDEYVRQQIAEKREKARLAQLERMRAEGQLLPREAVHALLGRVAEVLRGGGQTMQRQYGEGPYALLVELLDDVERTVDSCFTPEPQPGAPDDARSDDPPAAKPKPKRKRAAKRKSPTK